MQTKPLSRRTMYVGREPFGRLAVYKRAWPDRREWRLFVRIPDPRADDKPRWRVFDFAIKDTHSIGHVVMFEAQTYLADPQLQRLTKKVFTRHKMGWGGGRA